MMVKQKGNLHVITHSQASGETAGFSGVYRPLRHKHPAGEDFLVVKGAALPFCAVCGEKIRFHLLRKIAHIDDDPDFANK